MVLARWKSYSAWRKNVDVMNNNVPGANCIYCTHSSAPSNNIATACKTFYLTGKPAYSMQAVRPEKPPLEKTTDVAEGRMFCDGGRVWEGDVWKLRPPWNIKIIL